MLRSRRLQVVLAVEERKEQAALERLTEARERMQQHLEQVQNLQRYQQEYQAQMRQGREGPVSAARLQSWQAFVSQLDAVIQQQQRLLDQAERQFENCRQDWLRAWERRRGMEKYIDRCRQQEQREQDARDQKLADESAGRAFARRQQ
ncbi:flagellar export protein FliJ [Marinobacter lutaoensis]|jgi:flagellar FliJ protein|uniref:Flagellar FliJ protein n=1 Tax=Marinobacter lutaoensis TaxID=135739 RepID=A0A1V2DWV4_9GAMM|nr:flagellar export protein FliJ [Marinobacter lutaoensis]MBI44531.1 flagellar export protein FliJ [Oceanospirillales bacterium]NVD34467.1 flagellar export protein FliJ [Marinobacter lutaoensis]ONF45132.1 flagellar export protein FliJ [Marinobacter lutaoensis]|tara:strand:- start:687 stop:1130 length:444 start_codon:yes stop_codon:yes gene_type:complete